MLPWIFSIPAVITAVTAVLPHSLLPCHSLDLPASSVRLWSAAYLKVMINEVSLKAEFKALLRAANHVIILTCNLVVNFSGKL